MKDSGDWVMFALGELLGIGGRGMFERDELLGIGDRGSLHDLCMFAPRESVGRVGDMLMFARGGLKGIDYMSMLAPRWSERHSLFEYSSKWLRFKRGSWEAKNTPSKSDYLSNHLKREL